MAIIYRALWSDPDPGDPQGALVHARACFVEWVTTDSDLDLTTDGDWSFRIGGINAGSRAVSIRTVEMEGASGFRATVRDEPESTADAHTQWLVSVSVVADDSGVHTLVEEQLETDDPAQRVKIGRPRVVDDLLQGPGRHLLGSTALVTEPISVDAAEVGAFATVLRNPHRTLPYVVFTEPSGPPERWRELAARTAHRAAGVAVVVTLDHAAVRELRGHLEGLAVWGGAVRTYNLAPLDGPGDGWRHRYVTADQLAKASSSVVDGLVYAVSGLSTRRRVPAAFSILTDAAAVEAARVLAEREEEWEFALELEREERAGVERELAAALGHLGRLSKALQESGHAEMVWATHDEQPDDLPQEVQDLSEAVLAARTYLGDWLVVPEGVDHELPTLDTTPNGFAWGNRTHRGLRALAAFAEARSRGFDGDFWRWCERGEPLAWPATPKKLSMRESETVANNAKFVQARTFPIDTAVSADGAKYMEAHLKISEGGGDLAPRVYFHDDTAGFTGKVHVGFIGPHYLVPNTRS